MSTGKKVWAYRRENGRVGVRNYVAILPVDDISNAACVAVANHIRSLAQAAGVRARVDSLTY